MRWKLLLSVSAVAALTALARRSTALRRNPIRPWMNAELDPDQRAELLLDHMELDEQIRLLHGHFPAMMKDRPAGVQISAGYVPAQPRLGIPALTETDASLGVANAGRKDDDATALPSGLALAATFDCDLAEAAGAMIGKQARQKGFNVMLAGGVNLLREPRNGRNFEYLGEDPLLAGEMVGSQIKGVQGQKIVSTIKHFALNDQETGRMVMSAEIDEAALRESDLLAFQIGIEKGRPGAVMCAYNRVRGVYASENEHLLRRVLREDWGFPGWTMSDWGGVHGVGAAKAGLDQQSGQEIDILMRRDAYFDAPLKAALEAGEISRTRVRQMARRILRSMFAAGLFDHPVRPGGLDTNADAAVALKVAEQGAVLLKNDEGLLPLGRTFRRIVVIGSHADAGVLSGGGSSQVIPQGSLRLPARRGAPRWSGGMVCHPSSPLEAIRARAAEAEVIYHDGADPAAAASLAKEVDVAIVFASQWCTEEADVSLTLPDEQDALIGQVAEANPRTVVVLETGGPVFMPWLDRVGAVLEAWYPGSAGGEAIARLLYGEADPAGRLPATFPASLDQLPHPDLPGAGAENPDVLITAADPGPFVATYVEGSDVGYRWFARSGAKPLFPFGFGLSYTAFRYDRLEVRGGETIEVSFEVTNIGPREGTDTPQLYLAAGPRRRQQRLLGWARVALRPGEVRRVTVTAPRRLLANWDEAGHGWRVDGGLHHVFVGPHAAAPELEAQATVSAAFLGP